MRERERESKRKQRNRERTEIEIEAYRPSHRGKDTQRKADRPTDK